jgi:hypothetical protein
MENPCLTFIISSILESDEFLVIDVIHEVAHSWFGNAVTNATWEEMWLSEGLATYAQRRITTETYGTAQDGWSVEQPQAMGRGTKPGPSCPQVRSMRLWAASSRVVTAASRNCPPSSHLPWVPPRCCFHLPGDSLPPRCPAQTDEASWGGQPRQQAASQAGARYLLPSGLAPGTPVHVTPLTASLTAIGLL